MVSSVSAPTIRQSHQPTAEESFYAKFKCTPGDLPKFIEFLGTTKIRSIRYTPFSGDCFAVGQNESLRLSLPRLMAVTNELSKHKKNVDGLTEVQATAFSAACVLMRRIILSEAEVNPRKAQKLRKMSLDMMPTIAPRYIRRRGPMCGKVL